MELRDYVRGLRRHWLGILLMTLVGLGAAYGWTLTQTPVYEATASGLVQTRQTGPNAGIAVYDSFATQKVPTYLQMALWDDVAQGAVDALGLEESPAQVASRVKIDNPESTPIVQVTAQGASPSEAAALAEAWITSLAKEIDIIESAGAGTAPVTVYLASPAAVPTTPVSPDVQTALIVGGVLGLGFGVAFAMIRTVSDRRIRAADDIEARTSVPVVGAIPISDALSGDRRVFDASAPKEKGSGFAVAEALRALRTNLQFMDVDNPPRTIVVTSPLPSDGKSTIACNLAITLAASGSNVVLVDGDLRRSTVAKSLGLPGGAGLSDVLSGRAAVADVLQRTPLAQNLFVLTAGSVPPNPSEVLGSGRMHSLISDLSAHATVIIDAPPLLPVTDGAVLTHQADGALIVVTVGKTTYDLVEKSLDILRKSNGRALGIVLNKAPLRGLDASPYSYEYRRGYGPQASVGSPDGVPDSFPAVDLDSVFETERNPEGADAAPADDASLAEAPRRGRRA